MDFVAFNIEAKKINVLKTMTIDDILEGLTLHTLDIATKMLLRSFTALHQDCRSTSVEACTVVETNRAIWRIRYARWYARTCLTGRPMRSQLV